MGPAPRTVQRSLCSGVDRGVPLESGPRLSVGHSQQARHHRLGTGLQAGGEDLECPFPARFGDEGDHFGRRVALESLESR